jgi:hypothetical protein
MAATKILVPFSDAVARHVYPAMARAGLGRTGKRVWWERRGDGSWVLLEIQISKHTTRTELGFTVNTLVWPPGTWARQQADHPVYAAASVPEAGSAPICLRPHAVAPDRWPWPEFREIDLSADFAAVGAELREFLLIALEWGRAHADVEGALRTMTIPFGLNAQWAIIMLRAAAPGHPMLRDLVDRHTTGEPGARSPSP